MKNFFKVFGVIALVAVIGFSMTSCRRGERGERGAGGGGGNSNGDAAAVAGAAATLIASPASDFRYGLTADGRGIIITGYAGQGGDVVIPATIEDMPVLEIEINAFRGADPNRPPINTDNITSIIIPNTVEVIGGGAFSRMRNLTRVTLPDGLRVIQGGTFSSNRALTTINLPANLEEIHDLAFFWNSSLTELIIPESLTSVRFIRVDWDSSLIEDTDNGAFEASFSLLPLRTRMAIRNLGYTGDLGL